MVDAGQSEGGLAAKFAALLPHLDERHRRLVLGAEAKALGHGGIKAVARAAGTSAVTVSRGVHELDAGGKPLGRTRKPGGGRKPATQTDPGLGTALLTLMEPGPAGDPKSPLRWTTKSLRRLQAELAAAGHPVSVPTVAKLLKAQGFSLQTNAKTIEGAQYPDRDSQFHYLNAQALDHIAGGDPVISVGAEKKELASPLKDVGQEWLPLDMAAGVEWSSVSADHDTAEFAVASIATWWRKAGLSAYPHTSRLLITVGGGPYRLHPRPWTTELAHLAARIELTITVCYLPPGTSKWNTIEHQSFSHITTNWNEGPLNRHEAVVNTIGAAITRIGFTVTAESARKFADPQVRDFPGTALRRHEFGGEWNYSLMPG